MKFYEITGDEEFGEQPAKDSRTGERVTLTDKHTALCAGDYIVICRVNIVPNEDNGTPTQTAFQFLILNGGGLSVYTCDFDTGARVIEQHLRPLLGAEMNADKLDEVLNGLKDEYNGIKYNVTYIDTSTNVIRRKNGFESVKSAEAWISENAEHIKPFKIIKSDGCATCVKVYSTDRGTATATEVIQ